MAERANSVMAARNILTVEAGVQVPVRLPNSNYTETIGLIPTPPSNRDLRGLEEARDFAALSCARMQVGVWCNGYGSWNKDRTHPKLAKYGYPTHANLHAELCLSIRLGYLGLEGRTVYVARVLRDGSWALARPCSVCAEVLAECGVKRIVWTVEPGVMGEVRL